ncbi:MAG: hypothetical protein H0V04_01790 [Chloroflexi bacterium]|nr:hypothetical protein [Chloroflexota bacterium]
MTGRRDSTDALGMAGLGAPLRYLSARDVESLLPPVADRLALARRAMVALVADAELPPKIGVHPRPDASFAHAMPALLRGPARDGSRDLLGIKWVSGFPGNDGREVARIHGTVILDDPRSGVPLAFIDAGPVTAHRTAAVSGVALGAWRDHVVRRVRGRTVNVTLVGAGVQAASHLPVLAHVMPGARVTVHDRHPERARSLAEHAGEIRAFAAIRAVDALEDAVSGADVVLTMVSFGAEHQRVDVKLFAAAVLIIAVDYDMCVPAAVARDARPFVVDEAGQFLATRAAGTFAGYPDPAATLGQVLLEPASGVPGDGPVLVTHLGVGLADLVFADAILRAAEQAGVGVELPR